MVKQLDSNTGYIFNFGQGHGAFDPNGRIGELAQADIDAHNKALAEKEIAHAKDTGRALFYERTIGGKLFVGTWDGSFNFLVTTTRSSWHNMAGANGRTDFYFVGPDGKQWHGVNIGDNDMVRCHRLKNQTR